MDSGLMFLDCPAYLDRAGGERCGLPAEVRSRFTMNSTDGPLESAMIRPSAHNTASANSNSSSPRAVRHA